MNEFPICFVSPNVAFKKITPCCCDTTSSTKTVRRKRYRARVAYDGTAYRGWQFQNNLPTIQAELEKVILQKMGQLVRVVGASRTDAGVHARGQAMHFDVPLNKAPLVDEEIQRMEFTLNQMLPKDIRISNLVLAPCNSLNNDDPKTWWNSIYDATGKLYVYRFSTASFVDPMDRLYRYHHWKAARYGFSEVLLQQALKKFVGSHDFSAFTNSFRPPPGIESPLLSNPIRTIRSAKLIYEGKGSYRIEFNISGAMYRMIRNIMGVIFEVMCGTLEMERIDHFFECGDRRILPKSAPANGLCLEEVFYDAWPLDIRQEQQKEVLM